MKKSQELTAYTHTQQTRKTLPSGEQSGITQEQLGLGKPRTVEYDMAKELSERNRDLDPQYVWRGKKDHLQVPAPILYQQERIYPKFLIDDMKRRTADRQYKEADTLPNWEEEYEQVLDGNPDWYTHEENWKNRLILGDSLQVMASLAENEALRGKVQMIYLDPPYGIKFQSNWQVSTATTTVDDGKKKGLSTEPEMIKAFRDTWSDGIHSYLGYLRDRLVVARDLLTQSGSIFVQIGDTNVHKVRALLDEVFGEENFVSQITYVSTSSFTASTLSNVTNHLLWFAKDKEHIKYHELYREKQFGGEGFEEYKKVELENGERLTITQWQKNANCALTIDVVKKEHCRVYRHGDPTSQGKSDKSEDQPFEFEGRIFIPSDTRHWTTDCPVGMERAARANRLIPSKGKSLKYVRYYEDFPYYEYTNVWNDTGIAGHTGGKIYVCQTNTKVIARCMLMTSDVGDLVLDPTCGSGTTAYVAEYWGRRWITIDTSRVALALARKRLMTAKYPYWKINGDSIAAGFDYQRVAHVTLKSIANNKHIDEIWEEYRTRSEVLCAKLGIKEEWQAKELPESETLKKLRKLQRERQEEMNLSIRRNADSEILYDKPYEDKSRCRVAGPFTVESVSPVRALISRDDGTTEDPQEKLYQELDPFGNNKDYVARMLEALAKCGVKQVRKNDKLTFSSVVPFQGKRIVAEALAETGEGSGKAKRYAVAIGPEFGCITRSERNNCANEALEHNFDALLLCAFGFEAHAGKDDSFGKLRILNVRMNSDLYLAEDLKNTANSNPFVLFGEPDIKINKQEDGKLVVEITGVDVFDPKEQKVRSGDTDFISCWMIDTDYNENAFFARQVFFPNSKSYQGLAKTLNKEVDQEEWESVAGTHSHPFEKPKSGKIAVKVINNFGDEVMKIYGDLP